MPKRKLTDADIDALAAAVAARLRPLPGNGLAYTFDGTKILPDPPTHTPGYPPTWMAN